jgi:hypothetical protein
MKIAIVHDWLVTYAGAERVLASLIKIWPEADLFSVIDFLSDQDRAQLGGKVATTTFIQRLPKARTKYQRYLPLMPMAIEQLDLSGYDLIISSSHAVAKGVLCGPDQLHVSYVHSPIRYAWDLQHQYLKEANLSSGLKGKVARMILHYMRMWDQRTAAGVDDFIANSHFIGARITKAYRRESTVIYPPVDTRGLLLHRFAHGAVQAHADDHRSLRGNAGQAPGGDRRRPGNGKGQSRCGARAECDAAGLSAVRGVAGTHE